ncbi:hypothetical protein [Arthrobacter sp.]|uniref:hypothetical protein n=1 Tax=Arthrobacter sp. TaxID=1667 RepID=UPI0033912025
MTDTRFHATPDGPGLCTARQCPVEDHYGSHESAVAAVAAIHHKAEVKRLRALVKKPPTGMYRSFAFIYPNDKLTARDFDGRRRFASQHYGVRAEVFETYSRLQIDDGHSPAASVDIHQMTEVDEASARLVRTWKLTDHERVPGQPKAEALRQKFVDFSTLEGTRQSMLEAAELFHSTLVRSGISDAEVDVEAGKWLTHFKDMVNAVESEAAGDFDVWGRGLGYFTASDGEAIVVNENYRTSAFGAENFKGFLAENPAYRSRQPEAHIRVINQNAATGASWTLKKEHGQWFVEKAYRDGRSVSVDIATAQDALDHVYHFNLAEIDPEDEDASLTKARYVGELVHGVETALEANLYAIAEQSKARTARAETIDTETDVGMQQPASRRRSIFRIFG